MGLSTDQKMGLLIRAGALMLENGAVAYRVDETLTELGKALGLSDIEIFATPTGLILGATGPEGSFAKVSHLRSLGINLNHLAEVSNLARVAGSLGEEEIEARLSKIESAESGYPNWMIVIGVGIACGAFAVLLGGNWQEFMIAAAAAAMTMILRLVLRRVQLVPLMVTVAAAFTATLLSTLGCRAAGCDAEYVVQIAAVLQLVPGVQMVTWVIDLATGDILSGITRAAYAALIAMGIALGMLLVLVWGGA